jgi:hypothetical protein
LWRSKSSSVDVADDHDALRSRQGKLSFAFPFMSAKGRNRARLGAPHAISQIVWQIAMFWHQKD